MSSEKPELHDLIHGLERRGSIRSDYSRRTLLATYDGRNIPPDSVFREIDFHDISGKGFATTDDLPPEHSPCRLKPTQV